MFHQQTQGFFQILVVEFFIIEQQSFIGFKITCRRLVILDLTMISLKLYKDIPRKACLNRAQNIDDSVSIGN